MKNIFWIIIIGILYYSEIITGTIAIIFVTGIFIIQILEAQNEKIEDISDKINDIKEKLDDVFPDRENNDYL